VNQEEISFRKAIWEGYMDQIEKCEQCGKDLDKRKDSFVGWIYYDEGNIKEEVFFCSPKCMVLKCVEYGYLPSNVKFIVKPLIKQAEERIESKGGEKRK
jgi:hypothetical protein